MPLIPAVFVALVFQHVGIGCIAHLERDGQRPDQRRWIVKDDLELHVPEIHAPESLGYAHLLRMRMAHSIEPGPVIESRALHYQRVVFPVSDRVAPPGGIWIFRELAAVQVDLPVVAAALVKHCDDRRRLHDSVQLSAEQDVGGAPWQTVRLWIVPPEIRYPL